MLGGSVKSGSRALSFWSCCDFSLHTTSPAFVTLSLMEEDHPPFLLSLKIHVGFSSFMGSYIVSPLLILRVAVGLATSFSDETGDG